MVQGSTVKFGQQLHRSIGVGVLLEINDEFFRSQSNPMISHAVRHLFFKRDDRLGVSGGEGDVVAVDAAADPLASVTIGAGKTGVHVDLADPAAETAPQVVAIGMDA